MHFIKKILVFILTLESRLIIRKYKPFIVAVTGSVGKTSTKDAIFGVLQGQRIFVRKSEKSMNSDIGLPLTVIGVPNAWRNLSGWLHNIGEGWRQIIHRVEYPDCLILEIGADHPGDIKNVARWLCPNIVVLTKISSMPVHVEFFHSPEQVFEEKAALARSVKKGGTLILFADDAKVMSLRDEAERKGVKVMSYGNDSGATVQGLEYKIIYSGDDSVSKNVPLGISFMLNANAESKLVTMKGVLGRTYTYPLIAAAAVGVAHGMDIGTISSSLSSHEAPRGRMNILEGINGSVIIDDTYNSSPDAVESALDTLRSVECSGAKIAILGDMMELGKYSAQEHRNIGKLSASIATHLVLVGQRSKATGDEAVKHGMRPDLVKYFDVANDAAEYITPLLTTGDIVLVKGSQSVRMERVVARLLREPQKAARLLVRQEKEWLEKR